MEQKTFIIVVAIATILITTLTQFSIRDRHLSPATKRLLWISLPTGIVALIAVSIFLMR